MIGRRKCCCSSGGGGDCDACEGGTGPAEFLFEITNANCSWTGTYVLTYYQECEWRSECMSLPGGSINLGANGIKTHYRLRALVSAYGSTTAVTVVIELFGASDCSGTAFLDASFLLAKPANTYSPCLDWDATELPSVTTNIFGSGCIKTSLFDRSRGYLSAA